MSNKINCPICGLTLHCQQDTHELSLLAMCFNPTIGDPLHSYVRKTSRTGELLLNEEFSIKVEDKYFLFSNDYIKQKSIFKTDNDKVSIISPSFIIPDFPLLTNLKNKIKMINTFQ